MKLGSQLLNKCPKRNSCGTVFPMWTDEDMPKVIGVPTNVTVYGSSLSDLSSNCKDDTIQVEVMRCSLIDHDLIYRYIDGPYKNKYPDTCNLAFCGMM